MKLTRHSTRKVRVWTAMVLDQNRPRQLCWIQELWMSMAPHVYRLDMADTLELLTPVVTPQGEWRMVHVGGNRRKSVRWSNAIFEELDDQPPPPSTGMSVLADADGRPWNQKAQKWGTVRRGPSVYGRESLYEWRLFSKTWYSHRTWEEAPIPEYDDIVTVW